MLCRWITWLSHLYGFSHRVIYAPLSSPFTVLAGINAKQPTGVNDYDRQVKLETTISQLLSILWSASSRDEQNPATMAKLMVWLPLALKVILCRKQPVSMMALKWVFRIGSGECRQLIETCTDREVKWKWQYLFDLRERNNTRQLGEDIGSSERFLTIVVSTLFGAHCGDKDIGDLAGKGYVLLFDGAGVPVNLVTPTFRGLNLSLFQSQFDYYTRTGKQRNVIHILEELPATGLWDPALENMFLEGKKTGWKPWAIQQELGYLMPQQTQVLMGCTDIHEYFNPGGFDLAVMEGKELGIGTLDPDFVERQRKVPRQVHAGYEWVKKESITRGVQKIPGQEDHQSRSVTESMHPLAKYADIEETVFDYRSLPDQMLMRASQLCQMRVGEFMKTHKGPWGLYTSPEPEYCELPDDPFSAKRFEGIRRKIVDQIIARSQEHKCFTTPTTELCLPKPEPIRIPARNGNIHETVKRLIPAGMA